LDIISIEIWIFYELKFDSCDLFTTLSKIDEFPNKGNCLTLPIKCSAIFLCQGDGGSVTFF